MFGKTWNPFEYDGISEITVPVNKIWVTYEISFYSN